MVGAPLKMWWRRVQVPEVKRAVSYSTRASGRRLFKPNAVQSWWGFVGRKVYVAGRWFGLREVVVRPAPFSAKVVSGEKWHGQEKLA